MDYDHHAALFGDFGHFPLRSLYRDGIIIDSKAKKLIKEYGDGQIFAE